MLALSSKTKCIYTVVDAVCNEELVGMEGVGIDYSLLPVLQNWSSVGI